MQLKIVLILSLGFSITAGGSENSSVVPDDSLQIPQEKLAAIRELMQITGAEINSDQFADAFTQQMLSVLKANNADVSELASQIVTEEIKVLVEEELQNESLQEQIYPIYARYFTLEELHGLVEFNRSAVGRKANKLMPKLMQESLDAAQTWSQQIGPKMSARVMKRFTEEGININRREN